MRPLIDGLAEARGLRPLTLGNAYLQVKKNRLEGKLWLNGPPYSFHKVLLPHHLPFFCCCLFLFCFKILFCFERHSQGQRADVRGWRVKWDRNTWCEIHKESINVKNQKPWPTRWLGRWSRLVPKTWVWSSDRNGACNLSADLHMYGVTCGHTHPDTHLK